MPTISGLLNQKEPNVKGCYDFIHIGGVIVETVLPQKFCKRLRVLTKKQQQIVTVKRSPYDRSPGQYTPPPVRLIV